MCGIKLNALTTRRLKTHRINTMKAYVITGSTGEYDEFVQWIVVAFLDKTKAEKHVEALHAWFEKQGVPRGSEYCASKPNDFSMDPNLEEYWRDMGVDYGVSEVEVIE